MLIVRDWFLEAVNLRPVVTSTTVNRAFSYSAWIASNQVKYI